MLQKFDILGKSRYRGNLIEEGKCVNQGR